MTECVHCWHTHDVFLGAVPPQMFQVCCKCPETRKLYLRKEADDHTHGLQQLPVRTEHDFDRILFPE